MVLSLIFLLFLGLAAAGIVGWGVDSRDPQWQLCR
jgi:hypothetical protein